MTRYRRRDVNPRNQYRRWIDPRVRTLPLANIIAYLQRRGWVEQTTDRPGFRVFAEPIASDDGETYCQFVPDSEEGEDYGVRLFELVTGLAEVENRQATAVIDDILHRPTDGKTNGAGRHSTGMGAVVP